MSRTVASRPSILGTYGLSAMGVIEDLARAREAYERGSWLAAYDTLRGVDDSEMVAADFIALGISALLAGDRTTASKPSSGDTRSRLIPLSRTWRYAARSI